MLHQVQAIADYYLRPPSPTALKQVLTALPANALIVIIFNRLQNIRSLPTLSILTRKIIYPKAYETNLHVRQETNSYPVKVLTLW